MDPSVSFLIGAICLVFVGLALGLVGAGGSAIAVPVLVYFNGMKPHQAVAVSLFLIGTASVFGSWLNARKGLLRWPMAAAFAVFGIAGAWLGSQWSYLLSGRQLLLGFSVLLFLVGLKMMAEKPTPASGGPVRGGVMIAAAAFGIGVITGLLGVGGGFLIVPALVYLGGLPLREAIGTSLPIIAANSFFAFAVHVNHGLPDLTALPYLLAFTLIGMGAGSYICHRSKPARLKQWFAVLLLGLAVFMMVRNY